MTTTTSVLPAFLNAIQTALDAEAALDGVNVLSGPAGPLELGIEYVALAIGEIGLAQSWGAQETRYKKEDYSIPCELHARTAGAGEAARVKKFGAPAAKHPIRTATLHSS